MAALTSTTRLPPSSFSLILRLARVTSFSNGTSNSTKSSLLLFFTGVSAPQHLIKYFRCICSNQKPTENHCIVEQQREEDSLEEGVAIGDEVEDLADGGVTAGRVEQTLENDLRESERRFLSRLLGECR